MNLFAINMLLAFAWVVLNGDMSLFGLLTGALIGVAAMWLVRPLFPSTGAYFLGVWYWIRLVLMLIYELVKSSIGVVRDVFTPGQNSHPALIEVPLTVTGDAQITLVANFISLTPGTLTLDVSEDRSKLYVHAMFGDDPDAIRAQVRDQFEVWVREATE